jgi:hypothetical protein
MMEWIAEASPRFKARMAGAFQLLEALTAACGQVIVRDRFVVAGNAAGTAANILGHERTFSALGIAFVSLSEQMDTTTPTGKMVFTVLGAVAELERSLIAERIRAGLRNARAKGKTLGRPRVTVDAARIGRLRAQGRSIREIADDLGYSRGVVHKTLGNRGLRRVATTAD